MQTTFQQLHFRVSPQSMKLMKHFLFSAFFGLLFLSLNVCTGTPIDQKKQDTEETESVLVIETAIIEEEIVIETLIEPFEPEGPLPVSAFKEVWGYVITGREAALTRGLPISDVCYFSAEIDSYGKLGAIPSRQRISFPGRVHLVIVCHSASLIHFSILPGSRERRELIADIIAAARNYDGLQINFENVPARDGEAFVSFLQELRAGLGNKIFSVAIPARTRRITNDVYDYARIRPHVDRMLIMAYDEHWSGSRPGSIASLQWCRNVAEYCLNTIGPEKLIMGIPFYGRTWGNYSPSRALIYDSIAGIINERSARVRREESIPTFDYDVNVQVKVYYEDAYSLTTRMEMYKAMNVNSIGFWRIGQETTDIWKYLKLE